MAKKRRSLANPISARWRLLLSVLALCFGAYSMDIASAASITYTGETVTAGDNIHILIPRACVQLGIPICGTTPRSRGSLQI
jgi:hypothetical protein